jgi:hypothetical protein
MPRKHTRFGPEVIRQALIEWLENRSIPVPEDRSTIELHKMTPEGCTLTWPEEQPDAQV